MMYWVLTLATGCNLCKPSAFHKTLTTDECSCNCTCTLPTLPHHALTVEDMHKDTLQSKDNCTYIARQAEPRLHHSIHWSQKPAHSVAVLLVCYGTLTVSCLLVTARKQHANAWIIKLRLVSSNYPVMLVSIFITCMR